MGRRHSLIRRDTVAGMTNHPRRERDEDGEPTPIEELTGSATAVQEMADGIVMAGGSLLCAEHVPGMQQQPGRKPFLIAQGALTPSLIAEVMQGQRAA
jgi:hypothetical protein